MLSLPQLKSLVADNAVLSAAAKAGDVKLVYPKSATVSEDRLYGVWTLEILLVDPDETDLIEGALRRGGFEYLRTKTGWRASYSFALTPADRKRLEKEDREENDKIEAVKLQKKDSEIQTALAEIRAEIAEVKEDADLAGILKPKVGSPGPQGPRGPMGLPGRDAEVQEAKLGDLADVSDENPRKGFVLTWDGERWVPKVARIGGGSSGGSGGGAALTVQQRNRENLASSPTNVIQNVSTISFDTDSGFVVEDLGNGTQEAFVKINSTFNPWHVDGQTTLDATGEEPVEFVAGSGITITTDETADPKQIVFESTGTGGGVPSAPQDGQSYVRKDGTWVVAADYSQDILNLQNENLAQQNQITNLTNLLVSLQAQVDNLSGGSGGGGSECGVLLEECSDALTLITFDDGFTMVNEDDVTRTETENILD